MNDDAGNRIERCLSYDEKPLLLFQKLKDARKNPVFMLKHIKDIRSPIVVAQQKHAARKATSTISAGDVAPSNKAPSATQNRTNRPPKLEVNDIAAPPVAGASGQPGWPEVMSPSTVQGERVEEATTPATARTHDSTATMMTGTTVVGTSETAGTRSRVTTEAVDTSATFPHVREPSVASSSGVSYAVAIYPYMAEQDDEFDVVV